MLGPAWNAQLRDESTAFGPLAVSDAARNLALWRWASPLGQAFFHAPIFFLYWNQSLPVAHVLQLEAVYYLSVVVLEVPSGVFSDRVGRLRTLRLSAAAGVLAYALFFFFQGFAAFAAAQTLLAVHFAFRSGTSAAWHFELLESEGRAHEFPEREAQLARHGFWVRAACGLSGGAVGIWMLGGAYALSCLAAVAVLALLFVSREVPVSAPHASPFLHGIGRSLARLRNPWLAWIFATVVLRTTLDHIPYEFVQPWLATALGARGIDPVRTPLATGALIAAVAVVGGWAAGWAPPLLRRLGAAWTLLGVMIVQTAVIAALASAVHPLLAVLVLFRSVQPAVATVVVDAVVAPVVPASERATYLSLHSLAGRAGYGAVLLALGAVVGPVAVMSPAELRAALSVSAVLGGVGIAALALTRGRASRAAPEAVA